jgi:hypothetical protein
MPLDATISDLEQLAVDGARLAIAEQGGLVDEAGRRVYRIHVETAANVAPLATPDEQAQAAANRYRHQLKRLLSGSSVLRARGAYLALCFDEVEKLRKEAPEAWAAGVEELNKHAGLLKVIARAPSPNGDQLKERARAAGLALPAPTK